MLLTNIINVVGTIYINLTRLIRSSQLEHHRSRRFELLDAFNQSHSFSSAGSTLR